MNFHRCARLRTILTAFSPLALLLILGNAFAAAPIVDSNGFEAPEYSSGALDGQEGWITVGGGASSATVQSSVTASGSQAVQVDRGANSDDRWAVPVTGFPSNRFVVIEWDMLVNEAPAGGDFGPFFGVEAYDDNGIFGLLGSLGVDATTGDVLFQFQDTGVLTETDSVVNFGEWNRFRIVLDFQINGYGTWMNSDFLRKTGFVDRGASTQDLDEFTDADIATFAAAADAGSQALTGTAYFDNFIVRDGIIGDFDFDGDVDQDDLTIWNSSVGTNAGGDADGDGDTDGSDFLLWQQNYGTDYSLTSSPIAAVPEPASISLLLAALVGSFCGLRRR